MNRRIPYGVGNYEEIVNENYYYVDKTAFIRKLEEIENPIFLRPRRFGKTLWCSTLECYYDINRKDKFEHLFGKTAIGKNPTDARNSMLTLRFNFSTVNVGASIAEIEDSFNNNVLNALRPFVTWYSKYADFSASLEKKSAVDAMNVILSIAKDKRTPLVCVIIDEYDNFTNQLIVSCRDNDYYALTSKDSFLKNFYKTLKAGVESRAIARVFLTGVLPITIDDLTSGFNIGNVISLDGNFLSMLGFTEDEVRKYLNEIFADYGWGEDLKARVFSDLKDYYDGYRMLPSAKDDLFNSTICNFYLDRFVRHGGVIPDETVDENVKTDVNWLRRLVESGRESADVLESLVTTGIIDIDKKKIQSRLSANQFFDPNYFTVSLYYLGLITYLDDYTMCLPNATIKQIVLDYYNVIHGIDYKPSVLKEVNDAFRRYLKDGDWAALYASFAGQYLAQIPAQAFDKANENFFRTGFYLYCVHRLSSHYSIAIEMNLPSGRVDFVALPRYGSARKDAVIIEFKHYTNEKAKDLGALEWTQVPVATTKQVLGYKKDLEAQYPEYAFKTCVVIIAGTVGYRFHEFSDKQGR